MPQGISLVAILRPDLGFVEQRSLVQTLRRFPPGPPWHPSLACGHSPDNLSRSEMHYSHCACSGVFGNLPLEQRMPTSCLSKRQRCHSTVPPLHVPNSRHRNGWKFPWGCSVLFQKHGHLEDSVVFAHVKKPLTGSRKTGGGGWRAGVLKAEWGGRRAGVPGRRNSSGQSPGLRIIMAGRKLQVAQ